MSFPDIGALDKIPDIPILTDNQMDMTNLGDIPSSIVPSGVTVDLKYSPPYQDEKNNLKEDLTRRIYTQLRPLLPFLIGCHSSDGKIMRLCLENLFHFVALNPCDVWGSCVDPVLDCLLSVIYEGSLSCLYFCLQGLMDILAKIVSTYAAIPQPSMEYILRIVSSLHVMIYCLEDRGLDKQDRKYEFLSMHLMSLMSLKLNVTNTEQFNKRLDSDAEEILLNFASKLESSGISTIDNLSDDLIKVSALFSNDLEWQDKFMYLLLLVVHCRLYGRVELVSFFYIEIRLQTSKRIFVIG